MAQMIPVDSSMIAAIGYDDPTGSLQVEFTSGKVYTYPEVPRSLFDEFLAAPSKGQFFNQHIRQRAGA